MKNLFPAVFDSVWKRKETKIYLAFACFPLIYLVASFFGDSNFYQIQVEEGLKLPFIEFWSMFFEGTDSLILPTMALFFLTISVFKREVDDHTLFLYKDLNRKQIFWAKYWSLIVIILVFLGISFLVSLGVFYTRVIHMDFATAAFFNSILADTLASATVLVAISLKAVVSMTIASVLCFYWNTGATLVSAIALSIVMLITTATGGPIGLLFPTGYQKMAWTGSRAALLAIAGASIVTLFYVLVLTHISRKKFSQLEF
ncbi:hypothetical protein GGG87_03850 [Streptococcus sp. zg-86]|uniref:Uncharacterized protein n=1 Tax=Streptococcus zhangguiae TaxID=2664091 RepID=A0A6I4RF61_9STRE|nr:MULTISPECIES: hypothetical protein [unclassified Streptococcus]MTB64136.1 hypothetical protein [Streptococcus sp. zg-86]MTB90538.1 hypothetical protein [Streptococcus sp. zg-36]MWV56124.1 hypothetical protein [Streptococcus sp. zg-70]QTH48252.1 hypothetical protein J5M87_02670 [Streptococcus sp. zg-86]